MSGRVSAASVLRTIRAGEVWRGVAALDTSFGCSLHAWRDAYGSWVAFLPLPGRVGTFGTWHKFFRTATAAARYAARHAGEVVK